MLWQYLYLSTRWCYIISNSPTINLHKGAYTCIPFLLSDFKMIDSGERIPGLLEKDIYFQPNLLISWVHTYFVLGSRYVINNPILTTSGS